MKDKCNTNKALFIVLIVFAVIGLISVIGLSVFGLMKISESIKTGKDEVQTVKPFELKEDNITTGNENDIEMDFIEEPEDISEGTTEGVIISGALQEATIPEMSASVAEDEVELEEDRLQIVFMGDSILDNFRDETGIVSLVGDFLDADVLNLAIGGTCASIGADNEWTDEKWNSTSGAGVAKAVCGMINPDVFFDCTAKNLIKSHMNDFKNTDIFVIEYGVNDFMFGRQMADITDVWNPTTYEGGLRHMLDALTKTYPDAKIVMCQPSYVEFFRDNGEYVGNSYVLDNGPGTEYDYGRKMENLSKEYGTYFFSFDANGITMANASETLLDGVHLSQEGRRIYAENLSEFMKTYVLNE